MKLDQLIQVCSFFSAVLGSQAEIVIHDMETGDILWIANGEITGRSVGKTNQLSAILLLAERARKSEHPGQILNYRSMTPSGASLRASNLFVMDELGEYRYSVCVNQDVSGMLMMQGYLESMLGMSSEQQPVEEQPKTTVEALIMDIIYREIERAKPFTLDSREAKIRILKHLNEMGVFEVRHAGPKVCELLQIAQPTLYKYLKEIKGE